MSANHIVVLLAVDFAGLPRRVEVYRGSIRGHYEMFGRIYFAYDDTKSARNCFGNQGKGPACAVCWALNLSQSIFWEWSVLCVPHFHSLPTSKVLIFATKFTMNISRSLPGTYGDVHVVNGHPDRMTKSQEIGHQLRQNETREVHTFLLL